MVVVGTRLVVVVADRVPAFDVSRSCKLDEAATTGRFSRSGTQELRERRKQNLATIGEPVVHILDLQQVRDAFRWRVLAVHPAM